MQKKKILVTGATGFIGNHLIEHLVGADNKDRVSVIATSSNAKKVENTSWKDKVQYINFDFRDLSNSVNYFHFFESPDLVIHLAWEGLPNYREEFHVKENLPRHFSFLENMIKNGLNDLTVLGTCLEYGMKEGCLSEEMKPEPVVSYAIAKNDLRNAIEGLKKRLMLSFKWVRLFYIWGRGQNPNSLLSQLDKALADDEPVFNMSGGEQVRDYLPVEKAASYIINIALQDKISGIINCCSGNPISIKQLVLDYLEKKNRMIKLNLGYYPYPDYEPMIFWGDTKKLKRILKNE